MSRILAFGSLLAFLLNVGVHVATFIEGFPIAMRHTWPLLVATMILFFTMLGTLIRGTMSEAARMARTSKEELYRHASAEQRRRLVGSTPTWMILLIVGLVLYDVAIWVARVYPTGMVGEAVAKEGRFWLVDDEGRQVRQLTAHEYAQFEAREVRLASAQSAVFLIICYAFFTYRHVMPRPPTDEGGRRQPDDEFRAFTGEVDGELYHVDSLAHDIVTVWIDIPSREMALPGTFAIDPKVSNELIDDAALETEIAALFEMGARDVDVGFHSDWVSANFPVQTVSVNRRFAEQVVRYLIALKHKALAKSG